MIAADDYPLVDVLWTFILLSALIVWFWLLLTVLADLFRRHDLSGWAKAAWVLLVLVLPVIGAVAYLLGQGRAMVDRENRRAERLRAIATPRRDAVDEIARAKELLDRGALTEEEFVQLKRRVLA
ncbi:SHOCT domain-containing protein [Geodermatophilus sp. SYSU D00691]